MNVVYALEFLSYSSWVKLVDSFVWAEGESGCSAISMKSVADPQGALALGWPFRVVPTWGETARSLYPHVE